MSETVSTTPVAEAAARTVTTPPAGAAGVLPGAFGTAGYTSYQHWPTELSATTTAGGLGGTILIGMLAGVYPAVRAARLTPTEALATT